MLSESCNVHRFAGFDIHLIHPNLLVSVLEDHTLDIPSVVTTLCIIDIEARTVLPLVTGADFYAFPKFSPGRENFDLDSMVFS